MTDEQKAAAAEMLLEAYFATRVHKKPESGSFIEETKSSSEIRDDLSDMFYLSTDDVSTYMIMKGFRIVTVEDGTPRWLMFRKIDTNL